MRNCFKLAILLATSMILPQAGFPQESCSAFLNFGIYDEFDTIASSQDFRLLQSWLCDTNSSDFEKANSSASSAGIDLPGIIGLSGSTQASASEKDQKYHQFCTSSYSQIQTNQSMVQHIKSVNPNLMSVVKHCLDSQETGFTAWIATSADRSTFSYFARYRPTGDEHAKIRAFDITPESVKQACKKGDTYRLFQRDAVVGNAPIALTCPVDPKTTVVVTLIADKSGGSGNAFVRTLDGVRPEPPPDIVPTVVTRTYSVDGAGYSTDKQWLDTGLVLPADTDLTFQASGTVCIYNGTGCAGPQGGPHDNCAARGIVCGALYARIGVNGTPFFVGSSLTRNTSTLSGTLFLGVADIYGADNSGSFNVNVTATLKPAARPNLLDKTVLQRRILRTIN